MMIGLGSVRGGGVTCQAKSGFIPQALANGMIIVMASTFQDAATALAVSHHSFCPSHALSHLMLHTYSCHMQRLRRASC